MKLDDEEEGSVEMTQSNSNKSNSNSKRASQKKRRDYFGDGDEFDADLQDEEDDDAYQFEMVYITIYAIEKFILRFTYDDCLFNFGNIFNILFYLCVYLISNIYVI